MAKRLRVIFMGSPVFAVPSLERLLAEGQEVVLVVTQPDRPAGRGRDLRPPAVRTVAERHGLRVLQPERLNEPAVLAALADACPAVIVIAAFGQFLPRAVRELPPLGCVNVHASLLPKYRGAAPINWALIAGEAETGVTIMRVEQAMDAGPILLQRTCPIRPTDDAGALQERLAVLGAEALVAALPRLQDGEAIWIPQDESAVTFAPKLGDMDCRLDPAQEAGQLGNRVRGLAPAPGAFLALPGGRRLKVFRAEAREEAGAAGVVLGVEDTALVLGVGRGALALLEVQPEGKRRMSGAEYARGQRLRAGARLA
jgi:methionyl-tRNA formyltransferase